MGSLVSDTFSSFAKDLFNGAHAVDAIYGAINKVGDKLLDQGFQDAWAALSDPTGFMAVKAAIELAVGAVLNLINAEHEEAKARAEAQHQTDIHQQEAVERAGALQQRLFAATGASDTLQGQLTLLEAQAQVDRHNEQMAGNQVSAQLETTLAAEREKIISDFAQKAKDAEAQAAADRLAAIDSFNRAYNSVQGKGFLNDIGDLIKQVADFQTAGIDPTKLNQFFELSAQKIVDGANLSGIAIDDLQAKFPQLTGVIHAFVDATTTAIDDITKYLASLKVGTLSTLDPLDQLNEARKQFQSQLSQAQTLNGGGDSISATTQAADTFLNASRSFNASTAAYAADFDYVASTLTALRSMISGAGAVNGGLIGMGNVIGMVEGGIIGNGVWNRDSVLARYAGGGNIMLAGGEFVTRAPSVNPGTVATLAHINRAGSLPSNDNGRDRENFRDLARSFDASVSRLEARIEGLESAVRAAGSQIENTSRIEASRPSRPGNRKAS